MVTSEHQAVVCGIYAGPLVKTNTYSLVYLTTLNTLSVYLRIWTCHHVTYPSAFVCSANAYTSTTIEQAEGQNLPE